MAKIEKLIREGIVDFETSLTYSSNAGNLRLEMADFTEGRSQRSAPTKSKEATAIEIER
jgi:hypothetical protein